MSEIRTPSRRLLMWSTHMGGGTWPDHGHVWDYEDFCVLCAEHQQDAAEYCPHA